jgi:hypothetical protein
MLSRVADPRSRAALRTLAAAFRTAPLPREHARATAQGAARLTKKPQRE